MKAQSGPATVSGRAAVEAIARKRQIGQSRMRGGGARAGRLGSCSLSSGRINSKSSSGKARLTAPRKASATKRATRPGGSPFFLASASTSGQATQTQDRRTHEQTQPAASSHTSLYASTNRLGGSGWPAYRRVWWTKKMSISRHVAKSAANEYTVANNRENGNKRQTRLHGYETTTPPRAPRRTAK
eukprot:scaffold6410_cov107-Isochrysis_galbana.AAC.7